MNVAFIFQLFLCLLSNDISNFDYSPLQDTLFKITLNDTFTFGFSLHEPAKDFCNNTEKVCTSFLESGCVCVGTLNSETITLLPNQSGLNFSSFNWVNSTMYRADILLLCSNDQIISGSIVSSYVRVDFQSPHGCSTNTPAPSPEVPPASATGHSYVYVWVIVLAGIALLLVTVVIIVAVIVTLKRKRAASARAARTGSLSEDAQRQGYSLSPSSSEGGGGGEVEPPLLPPQARYIPPPAQGFIAMQTTYPPMTGLPPPQHRAYLPPSDPTQLQLLQQASLVTQQPPPQQASSLVTPQPQQIYPPQLPPNHPDLSQKEYPLQLQTNPLSANQIYPPQLPPPQQMHSSSAGGYYYW